MDQEAISPGGNTSTAPPTQPYSRITAEQLESVRSKLSSELKRALTHKQVDPNVLRSKIHTKTRHHHTGSLPTLEHIQTEIVRNRQYGVGIGEGDGVLTDNNHHYKGKQAKTHRFPQLPKVEIHDRPRTPGEFRTNITKNKRKDKAMVTARYDSKFEEEYSAIEKFKGTLKAKNWSDFANKVMHSKKEGVANDSIIQKTTEKFHYKTKEEGQLLALTRVRKPMTARNNSADHFGKEAFVMAQIEQTVQNPNTTATGSFHPLGTQTPLIPPEKEVNRKSTKIVSSQPTSPHRSMELTSKREEELLKEDNGVTNFNINNLNYIVNINQKEGEEKLEDVHSHPHHTRNENSELFRPVLNRENMGAVGSTQAETADMHPKVVYNQTMSNMSSGLKKTKTEDKERQHSLLEEKTMDSKVNTSRRHSKKKRVLQLQEGLQMTVNQVNLLESIGFLSKGSENYYPVDINEIEYLIKCEAQFLYKNLFSHTIREVPLEELIGEERILKLDTFMVRNSIKLTEREECLILTAWVMQMLHKYSEGEIEKMNKQIRSQQIILSFCAKELIRMSSVECNERATLLAYIWNSLVNSFHRCEQFMIDDVKSTNEMWIARLAQFRIEKNEEISELNSNIIELKRELKETKSQLYNRDRVIENLNENNRCLNERCESLSRLLDATCNKNVKEIVNLRKGRNPDEDSIEGEERDLSIDSLLGRPEEQIAHVEEVVKPINEIEEVKEEIVLDDSIDADLDKLLNEEVRELEEIHSIKGEDPTLDKSLQVEMSMDDDVYILAQRYADTVEKMGFDPRKSDFAIQTDKVEVVHQESYCCIKTGTKKGAVLNPPPKTQNKPMARVATPRTPRRNQGPKTTRIAKTHINAESQTEEELISLLKSERIETIFQFYKQMKIHKPTLMNFFKKVYVDEFLSQDYEMQWDGLEDFAKTKEKSFFEKQEEPSAILSEHDTKLKGDSVVEELLSDQGLDEEQRRKRQEDIIQARQTLTSSFSKIRVQKAGLKGQAKQKMKKVLSMFVKGQIDDSFIEYLENCGGENADNITNIFPLALHKYIKDQKSARKKHRHKPPPSTGHSARPTSQNIKEEMPLEEDLFLPPTPGHLGDKGDIDINILSEINLETSDEDLELDAKELGSESEIETELPRKILYLMQKFTEKLYNLNRDEYGDVLLELDKDDSQVESIRKNGHALSRLLDHLYKKKESTPKRQVLLLDRNTQTQELFDPKQKVKVPIRNKATQTDQKWQEPVRESPQKVVILGGNDEISLPHESDEEEPIEHKIVSPKKEANAEIPGFRLIAEEPNVMQISDIKFKAQKLTVIKEFKIGRAPAKFHTKPHAMVKFMSEFITQLKTQGLKKNLISMQPTSTKLLLKQICMVYSEKIIASKDSTKLKNQKLSEFVYDTFWHKYGLVNVAERKMKELLISVWMHKDKFFRVELFARFMKIASPNYSFNDMNFFYSLNQFFSHSGFLENPMFIIKNTFFDTAKTILLGNALDVAVGYFKEKLTPQKEANLIEKIKGIGKKEYELLNDLDMDDLRNRKIDVDYVYEICIETYMELKIELQKLLYKKGILQLLVPMSKGFYSVSEFEGILNKVGCGGYSEQDLIMYFEKNSQYVDNLEVPSEDNCKMICLETIISFLINNNLQVFISQKEDEAPSISLEDIEKERSSDFVDKSSSFNQTKGSEEAFPKKQLGSSGACLLQKYINRFQNVHHQS